MNFESVSWLTYFSAALCAMIVLISKTERNRFPRLSSILAFIWMITLVVAAVFIPGQFLSITASSVILGSIISFSLGHYLGEKFCISFNINLIENSLRSRLLMIIYIIGCITGLISIYIYIDAANESIINMITNPLDTIFNISRYYTFGRYNNPNFKEPQLGILFGMGVFLASLIGGDITAGTRRGLITWFVGPAPIFLAILSMLLLTTRATLMFSLAMWLSGFIARKCLVTRNLWTPLKSYLMISLLLITVCASPIYTFVQGLRRQSWSTEDSNDFHQFMLSALVGSPNALSNWLIQPIVDTPYGTRLLSGPLQLAGFHRTNVLPVQVGSLDDTANSNIISLFGDAINDLGFLGEQVLMGALGVVGGFAWQRASLGKISSTPILAATLFLIMLSPIGSPFAYTTICGPFVIFALIYWLPINSTKLK